MSASAKAPAHSIVTADVDPHRWMALGVVLLAAVMDIIDTSIVLVAIPSIRADLGASYTAIQWTVAGYTLAFALGLITGVGSGTSSVESECSFLASPASPPPRRYRVWP
jgi:MFS family permease